MIASPASADSADSEDFEDSTDLTDFNYLFIYLFLIYLKLTTQAVHIYIYTNKIAILLKIVSMLIKVNKSVYM